MYEALEPNSIVIPCEVITISNSDEEENVSVVEKTTRKSHQDDQQDVL